MSDIGVSLIRAVVLATLLPTMPAAAQQPLSASDWLSGSVRGPEREVSAWRPGQRPPPRLRGAFGNPQPVAESGTVGAVQVTRLGQSNADAAGTITAARAGLPRDLWRGGDSQTLSQLILRTPVRLPAMTALLNRLLMAQLIPPVAAGGGESTQGTLFLARADRLLDMGAMDRAQALLSAAGANDPEIFRRMFDIALLQGDEARACAIMDQTPGIAPSFSARIFCLAQMGDWPAAAISLRGAEALHLIDDDQLQLLTHFLDDGYVDSNETLEPAGPVTPLAFRIHEAVGQPLPTAALPLAFAQSDLRANNGWKTRLDAAERLARAGAIAPQRLRVIYSEQRPAASGGVWERAAAMQRLEVALAKGDVTTALPDAFAQFRDADMADVLAAMIVPDLATMADTLPDPAGRIAAQLCQWQGLQTARPVVPATALTTVSRTKNEGGDVAALSAGEALLGAMEDIDAGVDGDLVRAARGLAVLRDLGLTEDADLATAQLSLLPDIGPGSN